MHLLLLLLLLYHLALILLPAVDQPRRLSPFFAWVTLPQLRLRVAATHSIQCSAPAPAAPSR
jgi:hypothetical protein